MAVSNMQIKLLAHNPIRAVHNGCKTCLWSVTSIILWIVTSLILWIVTSQLSAGVAHDPEQGPLTGYCQPEPAEPRSHVGRVNTP